jgi:hypothetical protein
MFSTDSLLSTEDRMLSVFTGTFYLSKYYLLVCSTINMHRVREEDIIGCSHASCKPHITQISYSFQEVMHSN